MLAGFCLFWAFAVAYLPVALLLRRVVHGPGRGLPAQGWLFGLGCAAISGVLTGMVMETWTSEVISLRRYDIEYADEPIRWWLSFLVLGGLLAMFAVPAASLPFVPGMPSDPRVPPDDARR